MTTKSSNCRITTLSPVVRNTHTAKYVIPDEVFSVGLRN